MGNAILRSDRPFAVAIEGYLSADGETTPVQLTDATWSLEACSFAGVNVSGAAGDEVIVRIRASETGPVIARLGNATLGQSGATVLDADGVADLSTALLPVPTLTGLWWSFESDSNGDFDLIIYVQPSVG